MKTLLPLIVCYCLIGGTSAQEIINVYSVANDPEFSARIQTVQNTNEGGMLFSGRMRRGDTWYGHHVSRMDINGQPIWSTWFRAHGYVTGVFGTADGGAVQLYTTIGGREEILWFSSNGSLVKRMEYDFADGGENGGRFRLESASVLPNGNLSVALMGYRRRHDHFAGRLTIDFDSGEILETDLWEVLGMRTTLGRINPGLSDVYYVSGLDNNNDDAVIGAFKPNGELLRQWRLPDIEGTYSGRFQVGRKLFLLDVPREDRSIQMLLLDPDQDSIVWASRIPLIEPIDPGNRLKGQMIPKFAGSDEDHIYLWMEPITPARKAPQLATFSIHDGSLISVEEEAAGREEAGVPDVLNNITLWVGGSNTGARRFFSLSDETSQTTFMEVGEPSAERDCEKVLELTDDFDPIESMQVNVFKADLASGSIVMNLIATEKSVADKRPRSLNLVARQLCQVAREEVAPILVGVYPNPTTSLVTVEVGSLRPETTFELQLHGLLGQRIPIEREDQADGTTTVSLGNLPNGVYLITVVTEGQRFTERIIKQ